MTPSKACIHIRSLGGAIGADIAANFPHPVPFSGLIWLAGLPYLGDILPIVATPTVLGFLPGLEDVTNATLGFQTRIDFVESLSARNDVVPYDTKLAWLGSTTHLLPPVATLVLNRTQDPTPLMKEGASGWPLLILAGTEDKQINGSATIANMAPKFKNVESHLIPGGGHIIFFDDTPTVSKLLLSFIARIRRTKPDTSVSRLWLPICPFHSSPLGQKLNLSILQTCALSKFISHNCMRSTSNLITQGYVHLFTYLYCLACYSSVGCTELSALKL